MKEIIKRITNTSIIMSIFLTVIGLCLAFFPDLSISTFGLVAGIYLIIEGIHLIYLDITSKNFYIPIDTLLPGILSIICGVLLFKNPTTLSTITTIIIGIWMIAKSINNIKLSIALKDVSDAPWILLLVISIIETIIGLVVILNPVESSLSIITFVGIMLVIYSVVDIIEMVMFKRNVKKLEKIIKEKLIEG